jgi:hypothetical protein
MPVSRSIVACFVLHVVCCMICNASCILLCACCILCQVAKFSVTLALCCNVCGIARRSRMNSSSVTRSKRCRCRCSPRRALGKPLQHTIGTICNTQQHRLHACAAASVRRRRVTDSVCARRWVCYAEKTLGDYIIPHMSDAKSPQQVRSGGLTVGPVRSLAQQQTVLWVNGSAALTECMLARSRIVCSTVVRVALAGWLAGKRAGVRYSTVGGLLWTASTYSCGIHSHVGGWPNLRCRQQMRQHTRQRRRRQSAI